MVNVDGWWSDEPRGDPAEYACELARARIWRTERRFVATVADVADAAPLLQLDEAFAHAFVLVLSQLPDAARRPFADRFYAERIPGWADTAGLDDREALAVGAAVALLVLDLVDDANLKGERVLDLLQGGAQGDDLSRTPAPARAELQTIIARSRTEIEAADQSAAPVAAATAVVEVLDPSSGRVALREVFARAAWAAVHSWDASRLLEFLLDLDRLVADA